MAASQKSSRVGKNGSKAKAAAGHASSAQQRPKKLLFILAIPIALVASLLFLRARSVGETESLHTPSGSNGQEYSRSGTTEDAARSALETNTSTNTQAGVSKNNATEANADSSKTESEAKEKTRVGKKRKLKSKLHPEYMRLIKEYPFQPVVTEKGEYVNIILVRSPLRSQKQYDLLQKYKNAILFLGISSFEDYPLPPANPYSPKFPRDIYTSMFPGFLHMFRDTDVFPSHVKLLLMSQSDFALPHDRQELPKKYDFTFSGSDQDVANDCVGWSSFAKNWTFVKQALDVMCGEFGLTGVLVATKAKKGSKACTIPESCTGKMLQTRFLDQSEYFTYLKQSRFSFVPQVHDASPRVTTQSLALNIPLFMNRNIMGGWKYLNKETGEFFSDMSDFRESLKQLLQNLAHYTPRDYVFKHFGDANSGKRLKQFIEDNFQDHVKLPKGTQLLLPTGA